MNIQAVIVVILRLMALDFLLQVAVQTTPQIISLFRAFDAPIPGGSRLFNFFPWLVVVGLVLAAALLWFLASPIARFVTRGVSHDVSFGALSLVDCYSIAFMAVGLSYIASHLPQVLNWSHYLLKAAASYSGDSWKEGVGWYQVSEAFIPFIVGIVLFVNGRQWAVTLARRQTECSSPATITDNESI